MAGEEITVIKNDHRGKETWRYAGWVIKESEKGLLVKAYFNRSDLEFNGILLKEGDQFLELYPYGRWFNIFEVHDRDSGKLKAWYCNVTRPVSTPNGHIIYDDLALDLLVFPSGKYLALDYDEFIDLGLDPEEASSALSGLEELKEIFDIPGQFNICEMI